MLFRSEPHEPLKMGDTVNVTLKFADGSSKEISMPVKSIKGMGKGMMEHLMDKPTGKNQMLDDGQHQH